MFLGPGARVGTGELDRTSSLEVLREMGGTSTSMARNLYGAETKRKKTDVLKRTCEIFKIIPRAAQAEKEHNFKGCM